MQESEYSVVKIADTNLVAQQFNKQLGYVPDYNMKAQKGFTYYVLQKEDYLNKTRKLNKAAAILSGNDEFVKVIGTKSHLNLLSINNLL